MAMSWTSALGALDNSLESALARRQLENSGLMKILQQTEGQRAQRAEEGMRQQQIDENARWRKDENLRRQEETMTEDQRYRDLKKAEIQARADAAKQREEDRAAEAQRRREDAAQRQRERAQDRADRDRERAEAKAQAEEEKRRRDDPLLPRGVKQWITTLATGAPEAGQQPMEREAARKKINQTWGQLVKDHPDLDAREVGKFINELYTVSSEDRTLVPDTTVMMQHPETGKVAPVAAADVAAAEAVGYKRAQ